MLWIWNKWSNQGNLNWSYYFKIIWLKRVKLRPLTNICKFFFFFHTLYTYHTSKRGSLFSWNATVEKYATKTNTSLVGITRPRSYFSLFFVFCSLYSWFVMFCQTSWDPWLTQSWMGKQFQGHFGQKHMCIGSIAIGD